MKTIIIILHFILILSSFTFSQIKEMDGYKYVARIRGLQDNKCKVTEIRLEEKKNWLIVNYKIRKIHYLTIYEMYTWKKLSEFRFNRGFVLYGSYFSDDYKQLYLINDLNKLIYKEIELSSGKIDTLKCEETPHGCVQIEIEHYTWSLFTSDKKFFIKRARKDKEDILVYMDKNEYYKSVKKEVAEDIEEKVDDIIRKEIKQKEKERKTFKTEFTFFKLKPEEKAKESGETTAADTVETVVLSKKDMEQLIKRGYIEYNDVKIELGNDYKIFIEESQEKKKQTTLIPGNE